MTGTADTEAYEFQEIYRLETVVIPTHMQMIRADRLDQVYKTGQEKFTAVIVDIKDCYQRGQPVLVGTTSIETSELVSGMLQKDKFPHQVLNAKQHAREAEIVAQAGRPKMITIATNMAGRGTDIVLGGNVEKQIDMVRATENLAESEKESRISTLRNEWQSLHDQVIAAGGLHIIGTERHESRRIDNQLRGRSGRQGDPGSSRFYLSLDDPLLRIFAGDRVRMIMDKLRLPEGEPIEHPLVTRSIESAQRKVEAHNFDIRKQLLEYDDVSNDQRREIYELRNEILESQDVSDRVRALRQGVVTDLFRAYLPEESVEEQWDVPGLEKAFAAELQLNVLLSKWLEEDPNLDDAGLLERAIDSADAAYAVKMESVPQEAVRHYERLVLLTTLDQHWREHLAALDHLRQGIHLRGYAQKNPKQEYKREAFELFGILLETVKLEVTRTLMTVQLQTREQVEQVEREKAAQAVSNVQYQHASYAEALGDNGSAESEAAKPAPFVRRMGKIGRNDPCPCGSGKKYKHCHGKLS
jgi:preprotein translocase subunit SecA